MRIKLPLHSRSHISNIRARIIDCALHLPSWTCQGECHAYTPPFVHSATLCIVRRRNKFTTRAFGINALSAGTLVNRVSPLKARNLLLTIYGRDSRVLGAY